MVLISEVTTSAIQRVLKDTTQVASTRLVSAVPTIA